MGRSSEQPIDFVVTDTTPGGEVAVPSEGRVAQSTISRFACRILADRNDPKIAKIYAAGFDSSRNIFLGVSGNFFLFLLIYLFIIIIKKKKCIGKSNEMARKQRD